MPKAPPAEPLSACRAPAHLSGLPPLSGVHQPGLAALPTSAPARHTAIAVHHRGTLTSSSRITAPPVDASPPMLRFKAASGVACQPLHSTGHGARNRTCGIARAAARPRLLPAQPLSARRGPAASPLPMALTGSGRVKRRRLGRAHVPRDVMATTPLARRNEAKNAASKAAKHCCIAFQSVHHG
jgi:hypothetical protein